ncbi:MAG: VOC family protein [Ruminococcus sp.]|nr:VOC family protein [Ruminococcus sp.]
MKIDHVAIYVNDLYAARNFFMKYFDAVSNDEYFNAKTNFRSFFLSFDGGARLEIMNKPQIAQNSNALTELGYAHIALSVGSKDKVDKITNSLKSDGFDIISCPRITGDGYYESSVLGFENNIIEITV